jgi:hypothetical protein
MLLADYREQRDHAREMERESLQFDRENLSGFISYQKERLRIAGGLAALLVVAGIVFVAAGLPLVGLAILVAEIAALAAVEAYCESRVPESARDQLRIECARRGKSIAIVECRPALEPGRAGRGLDEHEGRAAAFRRRDGALVAALQRQRRALVALRRDRSYADGRPAARRDGSRSDRHLLGLTRICEHVFA